MSAPGASVPAFAASLTAPVRPGSVTINLDGGAVDRTQPLAVQWSGGSPQVTLGLVSVGDAGFVTIDCRFPSSAATGTVPVRAMQQLAPGTLYVTVGVISGTTGTAGTWSYDFDAIDYVAQRVVPLR